MAAALEINLEGKTHFYDIHLAPWNHLLTSKISIGEMIEFINARHAHTVTLRRNTSSGTPLAANSKTMESELH